MAFGYPVALELTGRRCVVVGQGPLAEEKARGLLEAGASVAVIAPSAYRRGDLAGAFLVIAATGDRVLNRAVFAEAEAARVLCNAVDDIEHCHFAVPSVLRRHDLVVAISTGGRSPALAKWLRVRLQQDIGPELGVLVDILGELRTELIATRDVDAATWARRWEQSLEADLAGLARAGRLDEIRDVVRRTVSGAGTRAEAVA
ncbi:MAG TPA: bifunctional precorrin-2 dehydrogenase/sirohydrochlorin ferrochelatase [Acidimicrobiia bacterium]